MDFYAGTPYVCDAEFQVYVAHVIHHFIDFCMVEGSAVSAAIQIFL